MSMKRKSSRRSSILKVPRPLEEVQNTSCDERYPKNKRVSFANTVKIKEIRVDQPAHASADDAVPRDENELPGSLLAKASDDADTVIQISTPRGKKRRRISTDTGSKLQRLSIIPKLERSFCLTEDDFEVYEDKDSSKAEEEEKHKGASSCELRPGEVQNMSVNKSLSMELTLQPNDHHSSFSLLSPQLLLNGGSSPSAKESSLCVVESLNFTCAGYGQVQAAANSVRSKRTCDASLSSPELILFSEPNSMVGNQSDLLLGLSSGTEVQSDTKACCDAEDLDITCTGDTSINCIKPAHTSLPTVNENVGINLKLSSPLTTTKQDLDLTCIDSLHQETVQLTALGDQMSLTCIGSEFKRSPQQILIGQSPHHVTDDSQQINNADGTFTLELTCTSQANDTVLSMDPSSNNPINLTHTIPPNEATFVRVPAENKPKSLYIDPEKCGDWLHNTSDDFLVDDLSLMSSSDIAKSLATSVCDTFNEPILANETKVSKSEITSEAVPVSTLPIDRTPREISKTTNDFVSAIAGDIVNRIKQTINSDSFDTTLIATPEAIQIDKPIESIAVKQSISIPAAELSTLECSPVNKSVIPSPSAYSKFCVFLDCDQTVLDTTCFPFPERVPSSTGQKKAHGTLLLPQYLQQLYARLVEIEKSMHLRLSESSYVNSHEAIAPALNILRDASIQALCAIQMLKAYGEISDTHASIPTPTHSAEFLSLLLSGEDLNGPLSSKVQWLSEMHTCLSDKVYPAIEEVMGRAQEIYHWTLNNWSKESICLTLAKKYKVSFQLSPLQEWSVTAPLIKILSVHIQSSASNDNCETSSWKASLIQCTHTADIPKAVFDAQKIILSS